MGLFDRWRMPARTRDCDVVASRTPAPPAPVPDVDDDDAPLGAWLRDHLMRLTATAESDLEALTPEQFDDALTARLVESGRLHGTGLGFRYVTPYAPGIDEVLTLDLPDTVVTLPDARIEASGRDLGTLSALGRRNLRRLLHTTDVEVTRLNAGSASCFLLESDSPYTASFARFPGELVERWLPGEDPTAGVVFAMPHRHAVVLQTCATTSRARSALQLVPSHAAQLFGEGEGPVSPHTYHWMRGRVSRITVETVGGGLAMGSSPVQDQLAHGAGHGS
jgi:hypothetical protein